MASQHFRYFATALDDRILARRKKRRLLDVRIHRAVGAADPDIIISALARRYTKPGRDTGALVPHAVVTGLGTRAAEPDPAAPIKAQLVKHTPGGWGRLHFPRYELFRRYVHGGLPKEAAIKRFLPPSLASTGADPFKELRQSVPAALRPFVWIARPAARLWWMWRRRRQLRALLVRLGAAPEENTFAAAARLADDNPQVVLVCALLADLDAAFTPRLSPWRRRRRSGFVLLLKQPSPALLDEVLHAYAIPATGSRRAPAQHVTVISALDAEAEPGDASLAEAAHAIRDGDEEQVRLTPEGVPPGDTAEAVAGARKSPDKTGRNGFAVLEMTVWVCVVVVGLAAIWYEFFGAPVPDRTCIGRAAAAGPPVTAGSVPSPADARRRYDTDKNAIAANNGKADAKERQGYTVKTIVYIGSGVVGESLDEPQFNGVIPELSGIRLAQERLNELADNEPRSRNNLNGNVYFRVDVREAGAHFAQAKQVAAQVAKQSKQQVLGVIGLGESRSETLQAQHVLGEGGLPMLGIGATSEDLQGNALYRQVSWDNPRQSRLAADFVRNANIIADNKNPTSCRPAKYAVVIGDPADDYSLTLSRDFAQEFPSSQLLWDGAQGVPRATVAASLNELATLVCDRLNRQHRTVVYWSGRARRLRDFLKEAKGIAECPPTFTVVAGADTTTTATRAEQFGREFPGVTLFHSAHALSTAPPNSRVGADFAQRYDQRYGTDAWYDHWRAPVAYDALLTMAQAINTACQENQQAGCGRGSIQSQMAHGVGGSGGVLGATGTIVYPQNASGTAAKVPANKRFLMLRDNGGRPVIVMECGGRAARDVRTGWGPGGKFACVH